MQAGKDFRKIDPEQCNNNAKQTDDIQHMLEGVSFGPGIMSVQVNRIDEPADQ